MTGPVFVDANVLIYSRDEREPHKRAAARAWLDELWRNDRGRTSVQVLSEVYVNLKRRSAGNLASDEAWQEVEKYLAWRPQAVDGKLVARARAIEQRHRLSWWDCTIVAAAEFQHCAVLLTEDLQDGGVYGTVTVRSPFTNKVEQAAAPYAARPLFTHLHRPRGRPRRGQTPVFR